MNEKPKLKNPFRGRRRARVLALEALYRMDLVGGDPQEILEDILRRESPPEEIAAYTRNLFFTAVRNLKEIDTLIRETLEHWSLERLTAIDRSILRMAIGEMLFSREVPFRVVIDEAVELSKIYSKEEAHRFVNGVLDAVARKAGLKEEENP